MELTINVQVGVSPEVAELVRKAVAMIMSVRQPAEAPTMGDVRSAMHKARQRIEGENYKDDGTIGINVPF